MKIEVVQGKGSPTAKRKPRRPQHSFNLLTRPWQIRPFCIAPVMPGETMKNLLLQARVVTDPISDPLIGWWCEHYFFYVKLRDLDQRDMFTDMIMSPDLTNATAAILADAAATPAEPRLYHKRGTNYVGKCLDVVTRWYFRDEDETAVPKLDLMPQAKINLDGVWQSLIPDSKVADTGEMLPGEAETDDPDGVITGFSNQYAHWQAMRSMSLTSATFEDYLKSYGVSVPAEIREELHKPELIRYVRDWSYPSNTINPANGAPSSAVSWSVAERADKDRYFKEPGFIFGVQVVRPKVYLREVRGSFTSLLNKGKYWMPQALEHLGYTTLEKLSAGDTLMPGTGEDVWIDMKDLFLHGEQFHWASNPLDNVTNGVPLPGLGGNLKYISNVADIAPFFKNPVGNQVFVKTDGVVSLDIHGHLSETTA